MTSAHDVETSVTTNGPSRNSFHPDDQIPSKFAKCSDCLQLFSRNLTNQTQSNDILNNLLSVSFFSLSSLNRERLIAEGRQITRQEVDSMKHGSNLLSALTMILFHGKLCYIQLNRDFISAF